MLEALLYLYTGLYYLRPLEWEGLRVDFPIVLIVGVLAVAAVALKMMQDHTLLVTKPGVYLLGFTAAIFFSHLSHGYIGGGVKSLQAFLPAFAGFFLTAAALTTKKKVERFLVFLLLLCAFLCIEGIIQHTTGIAHGGMTPIFVKEYLSNVEQTTFERIRWYGPFNDPNDLGLALSATVPLLVGMWVRKKRLIPFVITPLILTGIYLTNSRGAVLAALIGTTVYFLFRYRSKKALLLGAVLGGIALLASPSRLAQMGGDESSQGRVDAWYGGFQMLKSYPLFGVGMGSFTEYHPLTAHNSYMLVLAELGLVGSFFFVGFCLYHLKWLYDNQCWADSLDITEKSWHDTMLSIMGAHVGVLAAMFFLSRAYMLLPYMTGGLLAASATLIRGDATATFHFKESFTFGSLIGLVVAQVITMKIVVSVLL